MRGWAAGGRAWAIAGVTAAVAGLAAVPGAGGQAPLPACAMDRAHPTPVTLSALPARVVAGRVETVRVRPRGTGLNVADPHLKELDLRFERITDGAITFQADLLPAYEKARPHQDIGYEVRLGASSPGERAVVTWTDDDPAQPTHPCAGELRTGDMTVLSRRHARRPAVSARSGATDARHGDSGLLRIGGAGRAGCALTDPSRLTVVARSAGITRRLRLDMACGRWLGGLTTKVDRFTLLAEDGGYRGASRLYVSPRAAPTPGAVLTVTVYRGRLRLTTRTFRAVAAAGGTKVVARAR